MAQHNNCIEVRYEIEDGYAGKARPQTFMLCEDELFEHFGITPNAEEVSDYIHTLAFDDMSSKIASDLRNGEAVVAWAVQRFEEQE